VIVIFVRDKSNPLTWGAVFVLQEQRTGRVFCASKRDDDGKGGGLGRERAFRATKKEG